MVAPAPARASQETPTGEPAGDLSHLYDSDFLRGDWTARHHKLETRLAGGADWIEFAGMVNRRLVMLGWGNSGDNFFDLPGAPSRAQPALL